MTDGNEIPEDIMQSAKQISDGMDDCVNDFDWDEIILVIARAILAERNSHASLIKERDRLREENERLRYAIAPFAAVAKHDIGSDEVNSDFFQPMEKDNHADRLRVWHFRQAFNTFSLGGDVDDL